MTANPAKIKAYLAAIKGRLLSDGDQVAAVNIHLLYLGVLKMELLLRGILVEEDSKVGNQIRSSVGKTLLVEQSSHQSVPKPLLAAANAMAGRVAEAYYHNLLTLQLHGENVQRQASIYGPSFSKEDSDAAIQRAKDIQDKRWLILLKTQTIQSSSPESTSGITDTSTSDPSDILQVALGYYATAAQLQSDTPPMWKKVWDMWTLLHLSSKESSSLLSSSPSIPVPQPPPFEAQVAIENLARIALSKGNTKRGSELQLRLIQSYLNINRTFLSNGPIIAHQNPSNSSNSSSTSMQNLPSVAAFFGDALVASRQLWLPRSPAVDLAMAEKARATLEVCRSYFETEIALLTTRHQDDDQVTNINMAAIATPDLFDHPELLLYEVLRVQVGVAVEDAKIEQEAIENSHKDHNRSVAKADPDEYLRKARESWVLATTKADSPGDSLLDAAETLRDWLMATWGSQSKRMQNEKVNSSSSRDYDANQCLAFHWVHQSIVRLYDRAGIIGDNTGNYFEAWNAVLKYIIPIYKEISQQIHMEAMADPSAETENEKVIMFPDSCVYSWLIRVTHPDRDYSGAKKSLIAYVVSILPITLWMLIADQGKSGPATLPFMCEELRLSISILSGLIHMQQRTLQLDQESEKYAIIGSKQQNGVNQSISQWKQAREAALCMVCQDDDPTIYQVTIDAIAGNKGIESDGYLGYLQCMVAWSGWYQRPWPHCTNLSDARAVLAAVKGNLGRPLTGIEEILLEMAGADAELVNGGFIETASKKYGSVLAKFQSETFQTNSGSMDRTSISLLRAHCFNGMARIQHINDVFTTDAEKDYLRKNLEELHSLEIPSGVLTLCIWSLPSIFNCAKAFELSVARQLIADSLIHRGYYEDAQSFLEAAVKDSPKDFDAAFALGAFLLRMALYNTRERNPDAYKNAQIHLIKAAKLDPSRANPFALLGVWFEDQCDHQRAKGCFTKSLGLDPCNPIAGRGLLRLLPREGLRDVLEAAINTNSPLNGWAWHSVGLNKAFVDGEDDMAAMAILKGLRCRDIASPESDNLSIFYDTPQSTASTNEESIALADVGSCYRRLGRFTASIRAFHSSIDIGGEHIPSTVLISCAQVELELGLFDEAAEKFESVLSKAESNSHPIASCGHASALLSIAERDLGEGKAGSAYYNVQRAIESCQKAVTKFGCIWKLLGDLYSLGASLPPSVFCEHDEVHVRYRDECIGRQLLFVARGEEAYRSSLNTQTHLTQANDEDAVVLKSSIQCDIGTNMLLQAQISSSRKVGSDTMLGNDLYDSAAIAFRDAIDSNPLHAPSWCGFGCAVLNKDPLLAQHSFCRSLQLEKLFPESYANIGFLYTSKNAFSASKSIMEALTQVADTPMLWMNCAFLLEREAEICLDNEGNIGPEANIVRAADAYRAVLQVMKHPDAQLGLSLTCRVMNSNSVTKRDISNSLLNSVNRKESFSLMKESIGSSFQSRGVAEVFRGVMSIEKSVEVSPEAKWRDDVFIEGRDMAVLAQSDCVDDSVIHGASLRTILHTPTNVDEKRAGKLDSNSNKASLQRQILCQPDRADLWISLSKDFIANDALEAAVLSAARASAILERKLSNPYQVNGHCSSFVDAKQISEAISLEVWLKTLNLDEPASGEENSDSFRLQRGLLMNPENVLARTALVQGARS